MPDQENIKSEIIKFSKRVGFDVIGFTSPEGLEKNAHYFQEFLENAWHGEMKWLEDKADRRKSPKTLWPDVKSIIMLGMNYGPSENPLEFLKQKNLGNISVYAKSKDYHIVVKKKLKEVARYIHREFKSDVKVFVDTAPVMEKPLSEKAGVGWQGKHTNLVSREYGSWLFIGSIFTTLHLEPETPEKNHCGSCQSCLEICPTNAFIAPYKLDARLCISYLTIEYKGHIDLEFRAAMGNRIYGCDDCLSVCPWNKYAKITKEHNLRPRLELGHPELMDLVALDDQSFRDVFSGSPIKRTGRDFFIRNVLIAIGNSGDQKYIPVLKSKLKEKNPYVRAMAIWALKQLCTEDLFRNLKRENIHNEQDNNVKAEWGN